MILEIKMRVKYGVPSPKAQKWMRGLLNSVKKVASESLQVGSPRHGTDTHRPDLLHGV